MKKTVFIICLFLGLNSIKAQETPFKLSLEEAIDYAIKNNYNNKVAAKNIDAAIKRKWETTTIGLPQINGTVDYQNWLKQQVSLLPGKIAGGDPGTFVPVAFGTKQNINASVRLSQLIFDGSYLVGLQSAKTYLKISEQAKEKTELTTREAVINAYGNVLVTEKSIDILESNQRILQKNLNETQKIYDNGLTELENVEQLQITLGTLENNLRNAKRLKEISYQMLNISLGNSINKKLELTDSLESLTMLNTDLNLLAQTFDINKHIDYQIAQNDRESKRLLMKLEKSKALPSLSAFINYGASANSDSFAFFDSDQEWFDYSLFGVTLNVPIFSSLGRSAKTAQARIELENADIRLEEIEQNLNLQAQTAKSEYQLSIENYETAKKNMALAERIEKKQQVKFFEGISSSFDLSQAQNQLYTQQNNYVQSMLNVIAKKAQLENALNIPVK
ncbi:outer membrane protein TolC [Tenacibaculum adriaticum]|uniref:Outer membrane protein TolC n=1 Tax=Tenacibaculum adriaticum TaxID=413713 RepID=A0A5S5DW90_9FLAO|nr:TolC family protein [Tenacibaculum adriaticum]TYQ00086.1 outer membrane protein TolC [Tenacibaculum adriaticum]